MEVDSESDYESTDDMWTDANLEGVADLFPIVPVKSFV